MSQTVVLVECDDSSTKKIHSMSVDANGNVLLLNSLPINAPTKAMHASISSSSTLHILFPDRNFSETNDTLSEFNSTIKSLSLSNGDLLGQISMAQATAIFAMDEHRCVVGSPKYCKVATFNKNDYKLLTVFDDFSVIPEVYYTSDFIVYDSSTQQLLTLLWPHYLLIYEISTSGLKLSRTMGWIGSGGSGVSVNADRVELLVGAASKNGILATQTWVSQKSGTSQSLNFYEFSGDSLKLKGSVTEFMPSQKHFRVAKLITSTTTNAHAVIPKNGNTSGVGGSGEGEEDFVLDKWKGLCLFDNVVCVGAGNRGIISFKIDQLQQIYQYQQVKKGNSARDFPLGGYVENITKIGNNKLLALVHSAGNNYNCIGVEVDDDGRIEISSGSPCSVGLSFPPGSPLNKSFFASSML